MTRKEERIQSFTLVFEKMFNPESSIELIVENAAEADEIEVSTFAKMLATAVYENIDKIDSLISKYSKNRGLDRTPKVSLAIMRLAVCEMLYIESIPIGVSINEAVELAKTFATSDDASYINGILGSISKELNK